MTRTSCACKQAKDDAKRTNGAGSVRFSSIACGLDRVLKSDALTPHFAQYAESIGAMRHVVSLVANHVILSGASVENGDFFQFYGRVWSAVDRRIRNEVKNITHFDTEVSEFFSQHDTTQLPSFLAPVMCRQQECNALATATYEFLHLFPSRLKRSLASRMVSIAYHHSVTLENVTVISAKLAQIVMDHADVLDEDICSIFKTYKVPGSIHHHIARLVRDEHGALVEFRGDDCTVSLADACSDKKKAHLLIPHLIRLSSSAEQLLEAHGVEIIPQEQQDDDDDLGTCDFELVSDDTDADIDSSSSTPRVWTKNTTPKPFAILPVAKLKRAMVYYGFTELANMLRAIHVTHGKKRNHDGDAKCAIPSSTDLQPERLSQLLFTFKNLKGKKKVGEEDDPRRWNLSCFRTDGVKVVLTFCSGMEAAKAAQHVSCLCEAGYKIPLPSSPVDLKTQTRGLFRIHPNRNDIADMEMQGLKEIDVTVVDPGFYRPVQSGKVSASDLCIVCEPEDIPRNASFDHIKHDEWMQQSGREERASKETHRRRVHANYKESIDCMSKTRRKSCLHFIDYSREAMRWLGVRKKELVCETRSRFRWKYEKKLTSFIDHVADRLFDRTTLRVTRQRESTHMTDEKRAELIQKLRLRRHEKRDNPRKNVVFFGDGTFSCTQKGHVSIPKKRLLKQLAVRGLSFLICESYTSKRCPCGQHDLTDKTFTDGKRVRVHKTDGGVCNVLKAVCDRDEIACVNMLMAAASAIKKSPWPTHLLRKS